MTKLLRSLICYLMLLTPVMLKAHPGGHDFLSNSKVNLPGNFAAASIQSDFISNARQLITTGKRSGEGYFSADGRYMIYQSESDDENPFYQIYMLDLQSMQSWRVSPGKGMTTCAWIHPTQGRVLFSSTHHDPLAEQKENEEIERRNSGQKRAYAWDFDDQYEIYEADMGGNIIRNLSQSPGYDAEGSWSPDGTQIVFASNRSGYVGELSDEDLEQRQRDPSYFMEIYIMNSDGSNVRRLTHSPGYDGGPFFSPDGKKIVWRRFGQDGRSAEIFTMNVDGSNQRQITDLGVMSWAPFYHPSGDYVLFGTNMHGHHNFELYMVDAEGLREPIRVTDSTGFDGLPVFSPDGNFLTWTSSRHQGSGAQIYVGNWNNSSARQALGLPLASHGNQSFDADTLSDHVHVLASDDFEGRMTGSTGEVKATAYAEDFFTSIGIASAGLGTSYLQPFNFTKGLSLGQGNQLTLGLGTPPPSPASLNHDWRPLSFSRNGSFNTSDLLFVGYGITAPSHENFNAYDSYQGKTDLQGKWVVALRYVPEGLPMAYRQYLNRYANPRRKAMEARERGAEGIIFVSGPNAMVQRQLIDLEFDAAFSGAGIYAISISDDLAEQILTRHQHSLKDLQDRWDQGQIFSVEMSHAKLAGTTEIQQQRAQGHNVVARLSNHFGGNRESIVIGAHMDHLGIRWHDASADDAIHYGADDNASGSALVMEIARRFSALRHSHPAIFANLKRDIYFALWSGEEIGLLGSNHFVRDQEARMGKLYPRIAAYINMDMVGRYQDLLSLQSVGSSDVWRGLATKHNTLVGLNLSFQDDPYLPTDSTSFYIKGVPSLSAFTGSHDDYHTPFDRPELLNYPDLANIGEVIFQIALELAQADDPPNYVEVPSPSGSRTRFRVYMGTIPDYAQEGVEGVLLSGVQADSPAASAGLQGGDIIVALADTQIANIYDYTYVLSALRPGETVIVVVIRDGERIPLEITPGSRT